MGCSESKLDGSALEPAELINVGLRMREPGNGRSSSRRQAGEEAPELQHKLEKLDEERAKLEEELRRLQTSAIGEADVDTDGSTGEKARVRFSKSDSHGSADVSSPMPTPSSAHERTPTGGRRVSSTSRSSGFGRLSTSHGRAAAASSSLQHGSLDSPLVTQASRTEMKLLSEMVNRGRRRTRYTHRQGGMEGFTRSGRLPPIINGDTKTTFLPRGGVHVQTRYGAVQFGLPPETIKDSMSGGLEVPGIFVVPKDRFNLKYGTNTAEVEFPGYFNFFVKVRAPLVAPRIALGLRSDCASERAI